MEEGSIWLAGGFSKNAVSQERMKRCSFVSFNFIMDHICTEILSIENKSQFHSFSQPTITCSKLTIETFKQVWNMFKVNNKDTIFTVYFEHILRLVLVFL